MPKPASPTAFGRLRRDVINAWHITKGRRDRRAAIETKRSVESSAIHFQRERVERLVNRAEKFGLRGRISSLPETASRDNLELINRILHRYAIPRYRINVREKMIHWVTMHTVAKRGSGTALEVRRALREMARQHPQWFAPFWKDRPEFIRDIGK